jgi:arsenite methyltransferase
MNPDAAFWNKVAESYASKPVEDPGAFDRKINITKSKMTAQDTILDIGCGTGSLALRLAPSAAHVHGLDFSSEMNRIAKQKATDQKVSNVTFHLGAFDDSFTAFADGSLDGVCAYSILQLVDRPAALARIYRLLKPGGFFISSTLCLGESWMPYTPLVRLGHWLGKAPPVKVFSKKTLIEEIERAGFVELSQPEIGAKPTIAFLVASKPR